MPNHLQPQPLTFDFLHTIKGNTTPVETYYNTKLTITGKWARITRHRTIQSLTGVKKPRPKRIRKDKQLLLKHLYHRPEAYVDYLFEKHKKILQNKQRSVTTCVDLARTNHKRPATETQFGTSFLLFTFENEPSSRKQAWRMLQKAMELFEKTNGYKPLYNATLEYGEKNGRLHFHIIFYNVLKYRYEWWQDNVWKHGWVGRTDINDITGVAKYITKTALYIVKDNEYVKGQRRYSSSRKLQKPIVHYQYQDQIAYIVARIKDKYSYLTDGKYYERLDGKDACQYLLLTPT